VNKNAPTIYWIGFWGKPHNPFFSRFSSPIKPRFFPVFCQRVLFGFALLVRVVCVLREPQSYVLADSWQFAKNGSGEIWGQLNP